MKICQVKKEKMKLIEWTRTKKHKEIDREYVLLTDKQFQMLKNNELLKSEYKGNYHISESKAQQEIIMNELIPFFKKKLNIDLEIKSYCYAMFDYKDKYTGSVCIGEKNQINITFSEIQVSYGHEKEIIMWEEWFSTTEEGLNLLINRVSKY